MAPDYSPFGDVIFQAASVVTKFTVVSDEINGVCLHVPIAVVSPYEQMGVTRDGESIIGAQRE